MKERLAGLLGQLVGINSVSPTLAGGPGEGEIAAFVASYLEERGLKPELQEPAPGRPNVVATIEGRNRDASLLLNAHLDTVGTDGMDAPFQLRREGDRLYGRGAYDMKGSVAVMLLLADHFARNRPPIDLLLTFVADEEDKSLGMEYVARSWLPQQKTIPAGGIFLEPTELSIGVCHKGFAWFEIEVAGRAAHGSRPEQGVDAIFPLAAGLGELERIQTGLRIGEAHRHLGRPTLHVGTIRGGSALSVIAAEAHLAWERRTIPGEAPDAPDLEFERVISAVERAPGNHTVSGRKLFERAPHEVEETSLPVQRLQSASPRSSLSGCSFWADSALGARAGIPSVLFGPLGHGAHAVDEWVSLESLETVYRVVRSVVEDW
jgi:acetylornithine deacetylase